MASFWTWSPAKPRLRERPRSAGTLVWTGASDLAAVLSEGANGSWVSDCEEQRPRKKNGGDSAELMCDRKSSRRHAGKRESSSRSSESGSRSADGAAPETPIVLPDGKELRQRLAWVCGHDLQEDVTAAAPPRLPGDICLHTRGTFLHAQLSLRVEAEAEQLSQEMFPPCWPVCFSCEWWEQLGALNMFMWTLPCRLAVSHLIVGVPSLWRIRRKSH